MLHTVVYYESRKRELKRRLINEGRCDERLKAKVEESTCLAYTGLHVFVYPKSLPSTESFFVKIFLLSKWTGVSLKGYRQNWEETVPGEEKVNQLLNTNCNKCHFNRFMKHVEKSIFQLYPQKVTL